MLRILFIGDIVGKIGRKTVAKILPGLKHEHRPDLVIANAENAAHGTGISPAAARELLAAGIEWLTLGDHAFDREKQLAECAELKLPVLRPANWPIAVPGRGHELITAGKHRLLLVNLIGRVFMDKNFDCPFRTADDILAQNSGGDLAGVIVDFHAEATSEKIAFRHYLDGRAAAIIGTHTHVMTNDAQITAGGTGYITDAGMVGAAGGVIGVDKENIVKTFLTQIKEHHVIPEKGPAIFNAVLITINSKNGKAVDIKTITEMVEIKE